MAPGAQPASVRWMVLLDTLRLVIVGEGIGVSAALAATRFISSLLYGLTPTDPISVSVAVIILVVSAILAGFLPARTASRVDPLVALKYE